MSSGSGCKFSGCLIGLLVVVCLVSFAFMAFYFMVWRVPAPGPEADKLLERGEKISNLYLTVDKNQNGWSNFDRAINKFDPKSFEKIIAKAKAEAEKEDKDPKSSPAPSTSPVMNPAVQNYYMADSFKQLISTVTSSGFNKKSAAVIKALEKANREVLDEIDEGFEKRNFFYSSPAGKGNQALVNQQKAFEDSVKATCLSIYLNLNGRYEEFNNKPKLAAKRYLESLFLSNSLAKYKTFRVTISYSPLEVSGLAKLIAENSGNRELCSYIKKNLDRIEIYDFNDVLAYSVHSALTDTLQQIKSGNAGLNNVPFAQSIIDREVDVVKSTALRVSEAYKKDPLELLNLSNKIKPPKFSVFAQYMVRHKILYLDIREYILERTSVDGLRILSAIGLFYADNGKYPKSLKELTPGYIEKVPVDLCAPDGQFRYETKEGRIKLYSLGFNRTDEGGEEGPFTINNYKDLVFIDQFKENRQSGEKDSPNEPN